MLYAEFLKKYYNAVDGTFYDAIKIGCLKKRSKHRWWSFICLDM